MSIRSDCIHPIDGIIKSPPRKAQRRRSLVRPSVRFVISDTTIQGISSSPTVNLSTDEIAMLWYTREEYCLMKKSVSFTVKLMEWKEGESIYDDDDEEVCPRGLEGHTRNGFRRKRQNVEAAVDTVLIEQEHQWEMNVTDDAALARLYRNACAQCSMEAWLVAQKDAKAAHPIVLDERAPNTSKEFQRLAGAKRLGGESLAARGVPSLPFDA
jgi:hypothetical protein